ncbi:MAG: NAD(P)-dependent glycerol-3-phosphate dehydrogenase [Clostridiales Family XIII bacterium]|nr:NAD(P)-dependent glycerol-3-phosphate dehydrogenase [Clostridiales Family XIII bacterium]
MTQNTIGNTYGATAAIIGAGSWGTALANLLANKGVGVRVYDADAALLSQLQKDYENKKYLPGLTLNRAIEIKETTEAAVSGADFVITAVPAQHFRAALGAALPHMKPNTPIVNVAKGIEVKSLQTISAIANADAKDHPYAALSGPSHAEEVALGVPTTVVAASKDSQLAEAVQDLFMTSAFRVYTNEDVLGVELGGALKNIIALGAGISDGMKYGDNTKAALMTRGIAEMARLGVRMGAQRETFFGLSGIGDLIVTCTSIHSRNRRCGVLIGEDVPPDEARARVGMVVEGIPTAEAAGALAKNLKVDMPITEAICRIVSGDTKPAEALLSLMGRPKKHEHEEILS